MTTELHASYHIAMPTAFNADESLNAVNTIKYMCYLKAQGVESAMVSGTTGEQHSMTADEKIALVDEIDRHPELADDFEVIFGVASIREREAMRLAHRVEESPVVKVVLLGIPPYIQTTQDEAYQYVMHLGQAMPSKALIIYNNPEQTGFDIAVDTFTRLVAALPNIVGIKETGDWHRAPELLQKAPRKIAIYAGGEHFIADKVKVGYTRISSIGGNLYPVEMQDWFKQLVKDPTVKFAHQDGVDEIDHHQLYVYLKDQLTQKTGIDMGRGRAPIGD